MSGLGDRVLIVNVGSSNIKFGIYVGKEKVLDDEIEGFKIGMLINKLEKMNEEFDKIVCRIVFGGKFTKAVKIDGKVLNYLESLNEFAPLHLPLELKVIKELMKKFPKAKHIACFDSAFHSTMPEVAKKYALPAKLCAKYKIQRYGFHGLAHQNLFNQLKAKTGKRISKVISVQLGSGVSLCAIREGKSIDTTMGFTPLEGCVMNTRSGSIDPAIVAFLSKKLGKSVSEVIKILETQSGLYGICGEKDMRKIIDKAEKGDKKAKLAIEIFVYSVRKHIGQMIGVLGGVDAIVLGGGISRSKLIVNEIVSGFREMFKEKSEIFIFETDEQREMLERCNDL